MGAVHTQGGATPLGVIRRSVSTPPHRAAAIDDCHTFGAVKGGRRHAQPRVLRPPSPEIRAYPPEGGRHAQPRVLSRSEPLFTASEGSAVVRNRESRVGGRRPLHPEGVLLCVTASRE